MQQLNGEVWQPPLQSAYRLNFDAVVFSSLDKLGFGAIIQNKKGEVMATMTTSGPKVSRSDEAEMLACRRAIEFAVDVSFSRLIIKGYNVNVIQAISSPLVKNSLFGNMVDDIRHLIHGL